MKNDSVPDSIPKTAAVTQNVLSDSDFIQNVIDFLSACTDSSGRLATLLADSLDYEGRKFSKTDFISLMRDSLRAGSFTANLPVDNSTLIVRKGNLIYANYQVCFDMNYQMDHYYSMQTIFEKSGKVIGHRNYPHDDSTCIGKYKAICSSENFPFADNPEVGDSSTFFNEGVIYLFYHPLSSILNMGDLDARKLAVDSITLNGTIVKCYNDANISGDISESFIYISFKGKKFWTIANSNWIRHEDFWIDSSVSPPVTHLPYSSNNPAVYFTPVPVK